MNLNVQVMQMEERIKILEETVAALQRTISILTEPAAKPQTMPPQRKTG